MTVLPNTVCLSDPCHDILIERTVAGPLHGEVTVLVAKMGAQLGYLNLSPATIKVERSVFDVQLIVLEHNLRKFPTQKFVPSLKCTDEAFAKLSAVLVHG